MLLQTSLSGDDGEVRVGACRSKRQSVGGDPRVFQAANVRVKLEGVWFVE